MSAEDVGRVGGTEERGGEEERRVNERRYRTLTCFGLISAGCFVLKPLALIWGPQHLELIITHTPALLRLTVYMAITSTPIQTLYSLCAGTYCYTGVCIAVMIYLHKIQLHHNVCIRLTKKNLGSEELYGETATGRLSLSILKCNVLAAR